MIPKPREVAARRKHAGMSLVEVLVTLVSSSVGLLGIAALQLVSLRNNQEAYVRLQASSLASSMLDRIRTNQRGFLDDEYSNVVFNATGATNTRSGADLVAWQSEIDQTLPGGADTAAGAIERVPGANVVTVTIRWGGQSNRPTSRDTAAGTLKVRTEI